MPRAVGIAILLFLILQVSTAYWGMRLWINLTDSEPRGLYLLHRQPGRAARGDLVLMTVPEEFHPYVYGRGWVPAGWPLMKHVGAVPGDTYCVEAGAFTVNGVRLGPVYLNDRAGLPLPRQAGCRPVPAGSFLPVALGTDRSFDGRYMGPVAVSQVQGRLTPVFTLRQALPTGGP